MTFPRTRWWIWLCANGAGISVFIDGDPDMEKGRACGWRCCASAADQKHGGEDGGLEIMFLSESETKVLGLSRWPAVRGILRLPLLKLRNIRESLYFLPFQRVQNVFQPTAAARVTMRFAHHSAYQFHLPAQH